MSASFRGEPALRLKTKFALNLSRVPVIAVLFMHLNFCVKHIKKLPGINVFVSFITDWLTQKSNLLTSLRPPKIDINDDYDENLLILKKT